MERTKVVFGWILIIAPPLLLLPLAVTPFDIFTSLYWLFGWLCSAISVFSLVSKAFKKQFKLKKVLRPTLTIATFALANVSLSISLESAKSFAFKKAVSLQSICSSSKCPPTIDGWKELEHPPGEFFIWVGGLIKYPVYYSPSEHLDTFELKLRVNFEEEYTYKPKAGSINVLHRVW